MIPLFLKRNLFVLYNRFYVIRLNLIQWSDKFTLTLMMKEYGFISILKQAIPTAFDPNIFTNEHQWRSILDRNEVRYQWDPDRDLFLQKLSRRAIQIGIEGDIVKNYVDRWIIAIEDVTGLAANIRNAVNNKSKELPPIPDESIYCVAEDLKRSLGIKSR